MSTVETNQGSSANRLSSAYFSALARGGLTAAINYSTNLSLSQS